MWETDTPDEILLDRLGSATNLDPEGAEMPVAEDIVGAQSSLFLYCGQLCFYRAFKPKNPFRPEECLSPHIKFLPFPKEEILALIRWHSYTYLVCSRNIYFTNAVVDYFEYQLVCERAPIKYFVSKGILFYIDQSVLYTWNPALATLHPRFRRTQRGTGKISEDFFYTQAVCSGHRIQTALAADVSGEDVKRILVRDDRTGFSVIMESGEVITKEIGCDVLGDIPSDKDETHNRALKIRRSQTCAHKPPIDSLDPIPLFTKKSARK